MQADNCGEPSGGASATLKANRFREEPSMQVGPACTGLCSEGPTPYGNVAHFLSDTFHCSSKNPAESTLPGY